jgi:phosphatidate cytidylyltransferase
LKIEKMALNKEVFRTRAISALFFVAIMLSGLLWNIWSFLVLFLIIHAGCWWEYVKLIEKIENIKVHRWVSLGFIAAGMAIMVAFCGDVYQINYFSLRGNLVLPLSFAGFALLVMGILQKQTTLSVPGFARLGLGLFYISLSWGMMLGLRQVEVVDQHMMQGFRQIEVVDQQRIIPVLLIGSIWINDTMAYMVGSFIGKTPLSPISPKKTWEGTIGGAVLAIIVVALLAKFAFHTNWLFAIGIPFLGAVVGTLGDLLESKLKRLADVKDSGNMMPGHGGFLDRFDSMLLATPAVWVFVQLFG